MSTDCERFDALRLDQSEGTALSQADAAFVASHLETCATCRALERDLALATLAPGEPSPFDADALADERLLRAVVEQAQAERFGDVQPWDEAPRRRWLRPLLALAALLGVAVAGGVLLYRPSAVTAPIAEPTPKVAPPSEAAPPKPRVAEAPTPREPARVALASKDEGALLVGTTLEEEQVLEANRGAVGVLVGDAVYLWFAKGTRARLVNLERHAMAVALERGRVHASVVPKAGVGLKVEASWGRVSVLGTVFSVGATTQGGDAWVERGRVLVEPRGGTGLEVGAGEGYRVGAGALQLSRSQRRELEQFETSARATRGDTSPRATGSTPAKEALPPATPSEQPLRGPPTLDVPTPEPAAAVPSADALVQRALEARAGKAWPQAAAAYEALLKLHPDSAAARAALVSLGQLSIDHLGRPREGLASCERYTAAEPHGALLIEATLCRIRAEQALGERKEERALIEHFLTQWPKDFHADELRRRLEALAAGP